MKSQLIFISNRSDFDMVIFRGKLNKIPGIEIDN